MAEQHSQTSDYQNRWKFTGHELDRETGLYYAGARYYDPRVSIWLSVDPLAEKFPNWNPYNYVMQNPINLIDPSGMSPEDPPKGDVRIILNLGGGADIHDAARHRKSQIEKSYPNDKLIYIDDSNLGNLKGHIEDGVKEAQKSGYGKTVEFSVFSHNGLDGPVGSFDPNNTLDLSRETGSEFDKGKMSLDNW